MLQPLTKVDLNACIAGDSKAQYALYESYKKQCFGICLRYAKNQQDAEDMLQEGFYKVFKDIKQYSGKGNFAGWLRKIMINTALMHIRKYRKRELKTIELSQLQCDNLADPDFSKREKEGDLIIYLIQQLPTIYQTVFNLRAIEEYSFKEISVMLGINASTVRSHYLRARKALQKMYVDCTIEQK